MFTIIGADQKQYGPVSADEVRQWIQDGRADGRTLARAEGGTDWKPLSEHPEFAAYTNAQGLPPKLSGAPPAITDAQLLAGEPDFDIVECLSNGWQLLTQNFGLLVGASILIGLLELIANFIPFGGVLLGGVLYGGLYYVFLKRIRNQPATSGEAFAGFSSGFVQLMLAGFLSAFLAGIAYIFCVLPWLYLKIAWIFCVPLVIDKRLEFWTAMELSRTVVSRVWFKVFILAVVAFAPALLVKGFVVIKTGTMMYAAMTTILTQGNIDPGKFLTTLVDVARSTATLNLVAELVWLVNLPFGTGALLYAYEALFGTRPARPN